MATEKKLASQMSVQSCGSDAAVTTAEWVRAGAVGRIREVHVWSDRPVWPQDMARPAETFPVPAGLDWDLWLGNAPKRPYHPVYHPFNFRGWVDFGTGALGDPVSVEATRAVMRLPAREGESSETWTRSRRLNHAETFPHSSIVTWRFPRKSGRSLPVTWYDGGLKPIAPEGWNRTKPLPNDGIFFVGEKGVLWSGFTGKPALLPESANQAYTPPKKKMQRSTGHYAEWIAAAKGGPPAMCEFGFASYLTELTLLGAIAQRTGKLLEWDAAAMRFTNDAEATLLLSS